MVAITNKSQASKNIESIYPLSPMQEGMMFHSLYAPESGVYVEQIVLTLLGKLQPEIFQQAWQKVVNRHSALRTLFVWEKRKQPLQIVLKEVQIPWHCLDWQKIPAQEQQQKLEELLQTQKKQGFQLNQAPLMQCTLIKMGEQLYKFIWSHHHILIDGWCLPIIFSEVWSFYEAECEGKICNLPTPKPYKNYISWLQNQDLSRAEIFWRQNLSGFQAPTPLMVDKPERNKSSELTSFQEQELTLSLETTKALQSLAKQYQVTLSTVIQGMWAVLLSKYTGDTDVLFGVTVAGRPASLPRVETMIGLFINTLPLRVNVEVEDSIWIWLQSLQQKSIEIQEYSYTPLVEIQKLSEVEGGVSLFDSILVFENYPLNTSVLQLSSSLKIQGLESFGENNYPLTLTTMPGENLEINIAYNTDRFDTDTIARMRGHFQTLLEGIVAHPEWPIAQLPMLKKAERHQLLVEWNDTQLDYPGDYCIHQLFEEQVVRTPEAVAVVYEEQQLTYQELNQKANQLAHYLQKLGLEAETIVAIYLEKSLEMMVAVLGILKAGGAYLPIDSNYPSQRIASMLEDAKVSVLVTQESLLSSLPENECQIISWQRDEQLITNMSPQNPVAKINSHNLAYVIYTSGSTGKSKGVEISHQNVVNTYYSYEKYYELKTRFRKHLQMANFAFDVFTGDWIRSLCSGGTLVLCPLEYLLESEKLYSLLYSKKIDGGEFVPAVIRNLMEYLENNQKTLDFMKIIIVSSDKWYRKEYNHLKSLTGPETRVLNAYGVTEVAIDSSYFESTELEIVEENILPIGRPFDNIQMYILDKHEQLLPVGVSGELCLAGAGVARGYLNRPELTAAKFVNNPFGEGKIYKTGDLARYLPDGQVELIGRIDNQVKIRGFRIELGEIEANLNEHPLITESVVIVAKNDQENQYLVAYMITHLQQSIETREIKEFLQQRLPAYMIPTAFILVEEFALTANGKIDRKALPKPDLTANITDEFIAPRNEIEQKLALIWQEVLGMEKVGIEDNFFALGGHSLLATQVVSRIRNTFSVELPLRDLFEYPTIREISLRLERIRQNQDESLTQIAPLKPVSKDRLQPLSFAQERLWFFDQLEGPSPIYNICYALKIEGNLNIEILKKSFQELIARQESLRTYFVEKEGKPFAKVEKFWQLEIPIIDLSNLSPTAKLKQLQNLRETEGTKSFNLSQIPLLKVTLVKYTRESYILLLTIHHIIADDWSLEVLRNDLWTMYEAIRQEKKNPLPPLTIQYSDFAVWQRQWLTGKTLDHQLNYWQQQLNNIPPLLDLPTDYPRPAKQTYQGRFYYFHVPQALEKQIDKLNEKLGTTLFMFLLSSLGILLSRYSNQEDIVIGTPIANRRRKELESLMGFFVNSLPLRLHLSENLNFVQLLTQVKQTTLDAYEHQDIPFEKLVQELQPERSLSYNPLFQVMLVLNNTPKNQWQIPDLDISLYRPDDNQLQRVKFDLVLYLEEKEDSLEALWEYNTHLFSRETIARLTDNFLVLLEGIIQQPTTPIKNLPILSASEKEKILRDWNNTQTNYPQDKCIHQLFEAQVEKTPEAVAVVFGEQKLTYQELNEQANQLGHYLQQLGVKPETLVGICVERSLEMVIGLLGILKAGGAYVPIDSNYPQERFQWMLEDSQIDIIITTQSLVSKLPKNQAQLVLLDTNKEDIQRLNLHNLPSIMRSSNLAYVMYTSGSTGKPKGVSIIHKGVVRLVKNTNYIDFSSEDVFLQLSTISFDASTFEIWGCLLNGGKLIMMPPHTLSLEEIGTAIKEHQVTTIWLTAGLFHLMIDERLNDLKPIKHLLAGGDVLSATHCQKILQELPNCKLINGYGPTENTTFTCCYAINNPEQITNTIPIGKPIANTQVYILDSCLQPTPVGVPGELYLGGDGLARGYLNRPDLTAEKFIANPFGEGRLYKTGDLARYLPDGNIEFLGRMDNQVKIRGFRIEVGEIEAYLSLHPSLKENVVIAREDTPNDKRLVAYIVFHQQQTVESNELRQFLKEKLPDYMIPSAFMVLEKLPLTPNGKIDRQALLEYNLEEKRRKEFVAPRSEIEGKLATIWQQVLKIERIGIYDNFFELGGHSLLAVQIVSRIRNSLEIDLFLHYLFQYPTIEELSQYLTELKYLKENSDTIIEEDFEEIEI